MSDIFGEIKQKIAGQNLRIVLPEGTDPRIILAAVRLHEEGEIQPILIGNKKSIEDIAHQNNVSVKEIEIIDPQLFLDIEELVKQLVERRNGKITMELAHEQLQDVNYFGTMYVYSGRAHGLVSGAAHTTADTVRPALQIIKTKPGVSKTSGAFLMAKGDERLIFADCAISIAPTSEELAEIAVESAKTATAFGIEPKVAMLSFSTKRSAVSPETEKVIDAVRIAKENAPELTLDGEFQFDAAFVPSIAAKKAPHSVIKGDANVFVFPSLEAGNIGYKLVERLGGYEAIGPILQGLNAPVNDLSRGCSVEDVYKLALITAAQSIESGE